eukprot:TRINITY_DN9104_c0_g1_i5.p1 TRINITY_DN9104_c0_g1~~TRINITY_DN9104_c0_g1_i5.p1  ORF type:complete len:144 (-),score=46.37 TRINITY_DN9104_c0_g1_i5:62-493(-)
MEDIAEVHKVVETLISKLTEFVEPKSDDEIEEKVARQAVLEISTTLHLHLSHNFYKAYETYLRMSDKAKKDYRDTLTMPENPKIEMYHKTTGKALDARSWVKKAGPQRQMPEILSNGARLQQVLEKRKRYKDLDEEELSLIHI